MSEEKDLQNNGSEVEIRENSLVKHSRRIGTFIWVLYVIQIIGTAIALKYLPDEIPMHFNSKGVIDRYGTKYELIIFIAFSALAVIFAKAAVKPIREKLRAAVDEREKTKQETMLLTTSLAGLALLLVMIGCEITLIVDGFKIREVSQTAEDMAAFGIDLIMMITNGMLGLLLVAFGNVMPKSRINDAFGVRTSWSKYNDETWAVSNRIGGKAMIVTGILCIILGIVVPYKYASFAILGLIILMAVVVTIVSYCVYKKVVGRR